MSATVGNAEIDPLDAPMSDLGDLRALLGLDQVESARGVVHAAGTDSAEAFESTDTDDPASIASLFHAACSEQEPASANSSLSADISSPGDAPLTNRPVPPSLAEELPPQPSPSPSLSPGVSHPPVPETARPIPESRPMQAASHETPSRSEVPDLIEFTAVPGVTGRYRMRIDRVVDRRSLETMLRTLEAAALQSAQPSGPFSVSMDGNAALDRAVLYRRAADRVDAGMSLHAAFIDLLEGAEGLAPLNGHQADMVQRWSDALSRQATFAAAVHPDAGPLEIDFLQLRGRPVRPDWASALREVADRLLRGLA